MIGLGEKTNVIVGQIALAVLAFDQMLGGDEEDLPPVRRGLVAVRDQHTCLHRRIEEEVLADAEDAIEPVQLDQFGAHFTFLKAIENTVRQEDRAPAVRLVHARQDMLDKGIVRPSLRRRTEDVARPDIVRELLAIPRLDRIRRIREDHVEASELSVADELRIGQRVAFLDGELGHAMKVEIHPRNGRGDRVHFLSVHADGTILQSLTLEIVERLDEHAARAAGRIVDRLARRGTQNLRHQRHDRAVGVELLRRMPRVVRELSDQILVARAHLVRRTPRNRQRFLGEVVEQRDDDRIRHLGLVRPDRLVAENAREPADKTALDLLRRILGLDAHERLDQFRADVLGDLAHVAPMRPLGDADDVVLRSGEFGISARLFEIPLELLVVNVADALEEQKREDEFLVTRRVDLSAQENRRAPEVLLKISD